MPDRKKPTIGFWAAVVAAILAPFAIYVGAYLMLVRPYEDEMNSFSGHHVWTLPAYRWPGADEDIAFAPVYSLFRPLHEVDRKLRARTWPPVRTDNSGYHLAPPR